MDARYCPGDVTLHTNNALRKRVVTWSDPVFVDRDNATLSYHCTKKSGSEFSVGVTRIDCNPELQQSAASCVFTVNITGKFALPAGDNLLQVMSTIQIISSQVVQCYSLTGED